MSAADERDPGTRQALGDLARALRYVGPFRRRFAIKAALVVVTVIPTLLLPWSAKVLVDHVIQDIPLEDGRYPFFFQPIVSALAGADATGVTLAMLAFSTIRARATGTRDAKIRERRSRRSGSFRRRRRSPLHASRLPPVSARESRAGAVRRRPRYRCGCDRSWTVDLGSAPWSTSLRALRRLCA